MGNVSPHHCFIVLSWFLQRIILEAQTFSCLKLESQANLALNHQAKCRFWVPQSLGKFKSLSQLPVCLFREHLEGWTLKSGFTEEDTVRRRHLKHRMRNTRILGCL